MSVEVITITVTEWDQIQALNRMILSLSQAAEAMDEPDMISLFHKDMACLILLREELEENATTYNDANLPN